MACAGHAGRRGADGLPGSLARCANNLGGRDSRGAVRRSARTLLRCGRRCCCCSAPCSWSATSGPRSRPARCCCYSAPGFRECNERPALEEAKHSDVVRRFVRSMAPLRCVAGVSEKDRRAALTDESIGALMPYGREAMGCRCAACPPAPLPDPLARASIAHLLHQLRRVAAKAMVDRIWP